MKIWMKMLISIILLAGLLFGPVFAFAQTEDREIGEYELHAKAAALVDGDTGRLLYGKAEDEVLPMASTTKIMTCILALEKCAADEVVAVSSYASSMPDVQLNIKEGERYYLGDLLYSLMLESHNDTAVAIAEHIGGSVEGFAALMNEKAEEIGAKNTRFVTPNGLDAEGHGATAYDMALIGAYAIKNENFVRLVGTRDHSFSDLDGKRSFHVTNKDAFLTMMDGALGIKTGFTGKAGYCFVGALREGDKTFTSCVLASGWPPNKTWKWADTKKLMQYGLKNYERRTIEYKEEAAGHIKVENGVADFTETSFSGSISLLLSKNDVVETHYEWKKSVIAPVEKGDTVGTVHVLVNGETFASFPIRASASVAEKTWGFLLKKAVKMFFSGAFG